MLLRVDGLSAGYGDILVLQQVSLDVRAGEIVALIGSNGAGKTTLLRTLAGLLPTMAGAVWLGDTPITHQRAYERVRCGLVMVPEGRRLFAAMTVRQNLLLGAYQREDRAAIARDLARVYALFPRLREREHQLAGTLSGGEQQMCAIGRGLMAAPRLLMIDELSLGLAPVAVDALLAALLEIRAQGTTILLVEQDVQVALTTADRAYVLETGRVSLSGLASELLASPAVRRAYLGI
ncbi:MAG: ABC transporter ATP-binding protein [Chloroflexi bacterium]|nr:ABC transporter ATP-binding protein [Chloroflexota bacterium]